jgi:anti-anti-sigma factor
VVREHREPDPAVTLIGDIDVVNAATHGDLLCTLVDLTEVTTLLVDCSELAFLELPGMAMMARVDRHGAARGTEVWWTGLRVQHRQLLELAGLDRQLKLCPPDAPDAHPDAHPDAPPDRPGP